MDENNSSSEDVKYAGFWIRVAAALVDGFVTLPIGLLITYNFLSIKSYPLMILLTILSMFYKPLMEWRYGATLGKMALKIKVVSDDFEFINLEQAFGRYMPWVINHILSLLSYFYVFQTEAFLEMDSISNMAALSMESPIETSSTIYLYVFIIIIGSLIYDKRSQGIHDKIAKTFVIKEVK